jgi:hypothetical protein
MARNSVVLPAPLAPRRPTIPLGDLDGDAAQHEDDVVVHNLEVGDRKHPAGPLSTERLGTLSGRRKAGRTASGPRSYGRPTRRRGRPGRPADLEGDDLALVRTASGSEHPEPASLSWGGPAADRFEGLAGGPLHAAASRPRPAAGAA